MGWKKRAISTAFIFAFVFLGLAAGDRGLLLRGAEAAPAAPPAAAKDDAAVAAAVERAYRAVEDGARLIPADRYSPQAAAAIAGGTPEGILAWVRDNTRPVPYAGVLRGARGVLLDRRGNSLDRALLIVEMLEASGRPARLAHARIDEAKAREMAQAAAASPAPAPAGSPALDLADVDRLLARYGMDDPALRADLTARLFRDQRRLEDAAGMTAQAKDALLALLPAASRPAPAAAEPAAQPLDRWWAQVEEGGSWIDLDPDLGKPGQAAAPAESTPAPSEIDPSLRHRVTVRVVIERSEGSRREERVALEHVLLPAEVVAERVYLVHIPSRWPSQESLGRGKDPAAAFAKAAQDQDEWLPLLMVGGAQVGKSAFTAAGDLNEAPLEDPAAKLGRAAGGLFGGLGDATGGKKAEMPPSHLTAEWVELKIEAPGREPRTLRREVFDLLGPAARSGGAERPPEMTPERRLERGLALLGEMDLFLEPCAVPPELIAHLSARALLSNRPGLMAVLSTAKGSEPSGGAKRPVPGPSALLTLSTARWGWSRRAGDLFIDRPNAFAFEARPVMDSAGRLAIRLGIDILASDGEPMPGAEKGAFEARLEQGILDCAAEDALLGEDDAQNALRAFSVSLARGEDWVLVRAKDDAAWKACPLPADSRAVVEAGFARGLWAVVPREGAPAAAWWSIDPRTGATAGRIGRGYGGAMTEKIITIVKVSAVSLFALGLDLGCKHYGRTDGLCNPCAIMAIGALGAVISFANGAAAWAIGEGSGILWFGGGVVAAISSANRLSRCLDRFMNG